uniref:Uncharacterized protein n=1 Tax=Helianthus annuus TaxID=4232 RepID=A0A251SDW0_HELAN
MIHMPDFSLFLTHRHVPLIFTFLLLFFYLFLFLILIFNSKYLFFIGYLVHFVHTEPRTHP